MAAPPPPVGDVVAAVHSGGECIFEMHLPATASASDNIVQLKRQTMEFMTGVLKQQNMPIEDVDLMEEVVSDGEDTPAGGKGKGGHKGRKRKQQEAPKT